MKSIQVSLKTHSRLVELAGKLQIQNGRRKSMEDAVVHLLDKYEENKT